MRAKPLILILSIMLALLLLILLWPYVILAIKLITLTICLIIILIFLAGFFFILLHLALIPYYIHKTKEHVIQGEYSIKDAKEPDKGDDEKI